MALGAGLAVSLGVRVAVGASAPALTLAEAVAEALAQGTAARIASLEAGQADEALGEARSAYLPRASISSQAGYSNRLDERLRTVDASGRERRYGLSSLGSDRGWFNFYIDQLIFDLNTWRGVERAALAADAGRLAEAETREAISLDVIRRYVEASRFDDLVALDDRRLAAAERLDAHAASLLAAGRIVPSEREQASLALETLRIQMADRAGSREAAHGALASATGRNPAEPLRLAPESLPAVERLTADLDALDLEDALAGAPELQLLGLRRRMEDVSVAAARAERYPTVGLRAGYSNYGARRYDNFADELSVGVDVTVPLFDGYKAHHAIAGAVKGAEIARLRYEAMLKRKRVRVRELERQLRLGARKPTLAARQLVLAEEHARLAEVRLRDDRGTLAAAITGWNAWGRDARAATDARLDALVLWATLQREIGGLSAAVLGVPAADAAATAEAPADAERQP